MKKILTMAAAIVALSSTGAVAAPPRWEALSATTHEELASEKIDKAVYEKLLTREIVVQKRVTPSTTTGVHVAGFGIVRSDVEKTWTGITECENLPKFMPSMVDCHPIKAGRPVGPNERWTYNELKFSFWPITKTIKIIEDCKQYPKWKNTWKRVSGDTKVNIGSWRIISLDADHQLLVYDTITDVSGIPDWISRALTGSNLPTTVKAMRSWIEGPLSRH